MSAIGRVLIPSLILAALPSVLLCRTSGTVQYVGGTVESIPVNTAGTFNFDDANELRFSYGASVYRLPYEQITNMEITRAALRRVHRIPMPSVFPSHWRDILNITYKDPSGALGTLKFEMPTMEAYATRQSIDDKKAPAGELSATSDNDQWWGDRYWKTNRNKSTWDAQTKQAGEVSETTPPGTK
jgi:hypothetical protein